MILFTSDNPKRIVRKTLFKTMGLYLGATTFCILFDQVYALFGHGVRSASMTLMFFWPLLGAAAYALFAFFCPRLREANGWTLFARFFSSGIAILTMRGMLNGILEIAGTASPWLVLYLAVGGACLAASAILWARLALKIRPKEPFPEKPAPRRVAPQNTSSGHPVQPGYLNISEIENPVDLTQTCQTSRSKKSKPV